MTGSKLPARAATLLEFAKVWNGQFPEMSRTRAVSTAGSSVAAHRTRAPARPGIPALASRRHRSDSAAV